MDNSKNVLSSFLKEKNRTSMYLRWGEDNIIEGEFISLGQINGQFGPQIAYRFLADGIEKLFTNGSISLAKAWAKANPVPGDFVQIRRFGEGKKYNYVVTIVSSKGSTEVVDQARADAEAEAFDPSELEHIDI